MIFDVLSVHNNAIKGIMENILPEKDLWKQMILDGFNLSDIEVMAEKITLLNNSQLEQIILKQAIEINRLRKELDHLKANGSK